MMMQLVKARCTLFYRRATKEGFLYNSILLLIQAPGHRLMGR